MNQDDSAAAEIHRARKVAGTFAGRARAVSSAWSQAPPALDWASHGGLKIACRTSSRHDLSLFMWQVCAWGRPPRLEAWERRLSNAEVADARDSDPRRHRRRPLHVGRGRAGGGDLRRR